MKKIIPYGRQDITDADIQAVTEALKSDFLTQGPAVAAFEKDFAEFTGAKFAVAVTNATAALHLCALSLNVKPGQKILCTPNTFVASANCILYCGADVEFVDIDPSHFGMDFNKLEAKLAREPKGSYAGVVAVDFAGHPLDYSSLRNIADRHGLWIIEDACHAPGAEFQGADGQWYRAGGGDFADLATFSFHPVKHIATGEGGMITTNSEELYRRLQRLRTHGITKDSAQMARNDGGWYMEMQELGFNYRMPDILCALGSSQLKRIAQSLGRRREIADRYRAGLEGLPLRCPQPDPKAKHAYHLFVIQTPHRRGLYDFLKEQGIYAQVHYIPIYQQPYYLAKYGKQALPEMEKYYAGALSLPMFPTLTNAEQDSVIRAAREFFQKFGS